MVPKRRRVPSVFLAAAALAGAGCASSPWERAVTFSRDGVTVYEESVREGAEAPAYLHPVRVDRGALETILSGLAYERSSLFRGTSRREVFAPEEAKRLAEPLARALAEIPPSKRVRFLVVRSRWSDVVAGPRGTSAVVFSSEEGKLDLAFDYVDEGLLGAQSGRPADVVFRADPTAEGGGTRILPCPGARNRADDSGAEIPHWIAVELSEIAGERSGGAGPAEETQAGAAPEARAEAAEAGAREALEALDRLRAQGVLSEEEYRSARERALSGAKALPPSAAEHP